MRRSLTSLAAISMIAMGVTACAQQEPQKAVEAAPTEALVRIDASDEEKVGAIVRAYLLEHPEVIEEALAELDRRKTVELAKQLGNDPRDYSIGPADAPVTVVEFFDYRCGYCKASLEWLTDTVKDRKGEVRVVFKELPILSPESRVASLAALASGEQGKYWDVHQGLMASRSQFTDADIDAIAKAAGVDVKKMRAEMKRDAFAEQIADVRAQAIQAGATATPTFFINGRMVSGYDPDTLNALIEDELAKAGR